jgi:hypothetical protein
VILYGGPGETHETSFALSGAPRVEVLSGDDQVQSSTSNGTVILNYKTDGKTVVRVGNDLILYICDRNEVST